MAKKNKKKSKKKEYAKLNSVNLGISGGIIAGTCVFLTTLSAIFGWFSQYTQWATSVIEAVYGFAGYGVSLQGLILGTIYGFMEVFIALLIFGFIYNKLTK